MNWLQKREKGSNLPKFLANRLAINLKFEKIWLHFHTFSLQFPNFQTGSKRVEINIYQVLCQAKIIR